MQEQGPEGNHRQRRRSLARLPRPAGGWTFITDLALGRRPAALLAAILLAIVGVVSLGQLNRELFPDVQVPVATIVTVYPGADPESVTNDVTKPVEDAIAGVKGLQAISSTSEPSVSVVVLQFAFGTVMNDAIAEMNQNVAALQLPEGAQRPQVMEISLDEIPSLQLSLMRKDGGDPSALRRLAQNTIVPKLADVNGVRSVDVVGGGDRQIVVALDAEKLAAKGVSPAVVAAALQANNVSVPAGAVTSNGRQIQVQVHNDLTSVDAIKALPLPPSAALAAMAGGSSAQSLGTTSGDMANAAASSQAAVVQSTGQTYTVQPGDTLAGIAKRFYGNEGAWPRIAAANQSTLRNPNLLQPGMKLALPPAGQAGGPGAQAQAAAPATSQAAVAPAASSGQTASAPAAAPVTIGDLGDVRLESATDAGISRTNGKPSVGLLVYATRGADLVRMSGDVHQRLDDLKSQLDDQGVELVTISDQATYIQDSLNDLTRDALWGGLLAVLVIAVFLASLRTTAVIALTIPTSLLLSFVLINWLGLSLNIMTLGGLAVSTGRIVDDAVVVLESVFRHRQQGESALDAARNGTREVGGAVVSSTLTTVVVFLPLAFVGGLVGQFFRPFALTASLALLSSLIVALTLIPVLGSFILGRGTGEHADNWLQRLYTPAIRWALRHRLVTILTALAISAASLWLLNGVQKTFLPSSSEKLLEVRVEMPAGTPATATADASAAVEQALARNSAVEVYQLSIGDTGSIVGATGFGRGDPTTGDIYVRLHADADLEATARHLRDDVGALRSPATITVAPLGGTGPSENQVEVVVTGQDPKQLDSVADNLVSSLKQTKDLVNVVSDAAQATPQLSVQVDPQRASKHGLTTAQVAMTLRDMINGQQATTIDLNGNSTPVLVRLSSTALSDPGKVAQMAVAGGPHPVTVGDVANVQTVNGPVRVTRRDRQQAVTVSGTITGQDTGAANAEVQRIVDELSLPDGVQVKAGGVLADQTEGFASMGMALGVAVGLVYLVMVMTMGSVAVPLVIMVSLPLAAIGALVSLVVTGRSLGMSALIGLLMLIGIVVTNAIVLLAKVRQLREEGRGVNEALTEAGRIRVRPIVITALTTILGLAPLAAGFGKGSLFTAEMATVVMGGLLTATALTLVVVPVVYSLAQRVIGRPVRA